MPGRLRRHDEWGHIHSVTLSCYRRLQFLRHAETRNAFVTGMKLAREKFHIRWLGYVVMPEHVHLLILPQAPDSDTLTPISTVLQHLKGASGRLIKQALREVWRQRRSLGARPLDASATGPGEKPIWKPRGYDFNVVDERKVLEKLAYLHNNPVRRGLVARPDSWLWSSFRWYESRDAAPITMNWDGAFPLVV
jgi:putative transposase